MPIPDLWPDDFTGESDFLLPVTILREQASALTQRTKGILEAQVRSAKPKNDEGEQKFLHDFLIVAPALDDYTFELFYVIHEIQTYPARIYFHDTPKEPTLYTAEHQDELLGVLRTIFNHETTRKIVQSLIAQSKS